MSLPVLVRVGMVVLARPLSQSTTAEKSPFGTADPLQFRAARSVSFSVFATSGEIKDIQVALRELKDPAGVQASSSGSVNPSVIPRLDATGVTLPDIFSTIGDYHSTVVLSGTAADGKTKVGDVKNVTLTCAKPNITAPGLKDFAADVVRASPFHGTLANYCEAII